MNKVFISKEAVKPMTLEELLKAAGPWFEMERIEGSHCDCDGEGEFVLLSEDDPAVVEGGKRYMVCKKCNCYSHL